jgi:hypothetical protein
MVCGPQDMPMLLESVSRFESRSDPESVSRIRVKNPRSRQFPLISHKLSIMNLRKVFVPLVAIELCAFAPTAFAVGERVLLSKVS